MNNDVHYLPRYSVDTTLTQQHLAMPESRLIASPFSAHALQPVGFSPKPFSGYQPGWIPAILFFGFLLLVYTQIFHNLRFRQILLAPVSRRHSSQLTREGNLFSERISVALGLLYLLTLSLLLYLLNDTMDGFRHAILKGFLLYALIFFAIVVFLFLKLAAIKFLESIFKTHETSYQYLLNSLIFSLITGPILLILLVFIIYLPSQILLYVTLVIVALLLLLQFMRGFMIGMTLTKFSYMLLFVYLCSLEILPLIILGKVFLHYL